MNFDICQIYKGKKLMWTLPCKFIKKSDLCDEHFLIPNKQRIKPGHIISINNQEKFYVTDVRLHRPQDTHVEIYFETITKHKAKFFNFWIPTTISIVALLRPEIIKLINFLINLIKKFV
ncbi:MAG: hypothetical protein E7391_04055 [Ruminococcaceae bacterium]|nr:hypothetical protein [Oscillospiraceae bacterium]